MSTKKKLLISLCSLCLVAAVVVIGVFAYASQTLTIGTKVSFTASSQVQATVSLSGTNNGTAIDMDSATDGTQSTQTWTFTGSEAGDRNTAFTIPDQDFVQYTSGTGTDAVYAIGDIIYTVEIHNTSSATAITFEAKYKDLITSGDKKNTNGEISRNVVYETRSGEENATYAKATYDEDDGISIAAGSYLQITITYSKSGIINDDSFNDEWKFTLSASNS